MKQTIHYALILDQSGSMQHLKNEVISSFNEQVEMILKLKNNNPEVDIKVTLCIFNDTVDFKYTYQNIDNLIKLEPNDYRPDSCTALYDAMGISFMKVKENIQPDDKVFFAIFTDGLENASIDYTAKDIQYKIKKAEKDGWEIKFFCRYEDASFYRNNLNLIQNHICNISMNEPGMKVMESQIY